MASISLGTLSGFAAYPANSLGAILSFLPFAAIVILLLAFVDRGIAVAKDGDFFHRDVWLWSRMRVLAYAATVGTFLVAALGSYFEYVPSVADQSFVQVSADQIIVVVPAVFVYAVGALVVGGKRTSDQTMKRHIKMLGVGFLAFVVSFPFFFAQGGVLALFPNLLIIIANYFLYLAVMSLSSFGKIEKLGSSASAILPA